MSSTTDSEQKAFKLPRISPDTVSIDAQQNVKRGLEKQRQVLANLIFPPHIPGPCHPNVASFADLIRDLNEAANLDSKEKLGEGGNGNQTFFSKNDIDKLKTNPTNARITPLQEIDIVNKKCDVYLRRAKFFEKTANERKEKDFDKSSIIEAVSMAKIFQMNHRYCIASVSCPQRIAVLNHCFSRHPPEVVQALVQSGQHGYLCGKERKAVERCCGQKTHSVMRKILEDN